MSSINLHELGSKKGRFKVAFTPPTEGATRAKPDSDPGWVGAKAPWLPHLIAPGALGAVFSAPKVRDRQRAGRSYILVYPGEHDRISAYLKWFHVINSGYVLGPFSNHYMLLSSVFILKAGTPERSTWSRILYMRWSCNAV